MVDVGEHDDSDSTSIVIKEKYALIRELQINLQREKYIISYYEQENKQLEAKHEVMEIKLIKAEREAMKVKALLEEAYDRYGEPEEEKETRKMPRTRGLKRALELENNKEIELANELTLNEKFAILVNENQEHWTNKIIQHLENLLNKASQQNEI